MVAARLLSQHTPLLFQPDPIIVNPSRRGLNRSQGWKSTGVRGGDERQYDHDEHGAVVQMIVLRYTLYGEPRRQLANEYGLSERQIQEYVTGGKHWRCYTAPVFRALARLGISPGRINKSKRDRGREAFRTLSGDLLTLLKDDPRPMAREIVSALRLFTAVQP